MPRLRARLAIEGYEAPAPAPVPPAQPAPEPPQPPPPPEQVFDEGLSQALAAFQAAHGLPADGVLSAATIAALNVPPEARLASIDANLVRARWAPRPAAPQRIEVDTAVPQATLFVDGQPVLVSRVIAGKPTSRTPMLRTAVVAITFNPPWYVPASIAARELLPRGSAYLARHGFHFSHGQLIQGAGASAALGYVKFEMPNRFTVYLHDTPNRDLFNRDSRWLSHGCMRLQLPRELATLLLGPQGWTRQMVDAAIATHATRRVALATPTPVIVVHRTVVVDADGRAVFRRDIYGWDAKIIAAMRRQ